MWRKGCSSKNSVRRWWWKHEEKLVTVSSPLLSFSSFEISLSWPSRHHHLVLRMIYIWYTQVRPETRYWEKSSMKKSRMNGWKLQFLPHVWKTLSQPSKSLSLDQIHTRHNSTIPIVFFNQSLTNGLDWMANVSDLWLLFSVLKDCQSMWHFMKRVNSLMATIKLLSPVLTTTAIPGLGILISVIQGFSRLSRGQGNLTVATSSQKSRRSASPDVSSAKRRNISSSSEISPERPNPKAAVKLTRPPDSPSTPASLSGLRRMVRDDHGVSWTDYEVRKLFTLNHIWNTYNI